MSVPRPPLPSPGPPRPPPTSIPTITTPIPTATPTTSKEKKKKKKDKKEKKEKKKKGKKDRADKKDDSDDDWDGGAEESDLTVATTIAAAMKDSSDTAFANDAVNLLKEIKSSKPTDNEKGLNANDLKLNNEKKGPTPPPKPPRGGIPPKFTTFVLKKGLTPPPKPPPLLRSHKSAASKMGPPKKSTLSPALSRVGFKSTAEINKAFKGPKLNDGDSDDDGMFFFFLLLFIVILAVISELFPFLSFTSFDMYC